MLAAALADPDPVLIFEHGALFSLSEEVPDEPEPVDLDHARVHRAGSDVTVVAHGAALHTSLQAAEVLAGDGVSVEVIDLRTLRPLDDATILASVARTGRLVVAEDGWRSGGIGAEIAARVSELGFWDLDAPIERVASAEVPMPYARHLEEAASVQLDDVAAAMRRTLG
jgi:pyruvate dehydrogenase E1 component beta subunit